MRIRLSGARPTLLAGTPRGGTKTRPGAAFVASLGALVAVALLGGCSGGSSGSAGGVSVASACTGAATNTVCLDACSLGCRGTSCEITDIAQNENIVLRFSQAMDPRFVNESTIQFRTASGELPVGGFLVNGQLVEFVPRVLSIGTQSFFGFKAGETYTMTLPGGLGERNAARSTSGDPLGQTVSCTLRVTRGIVDLNGVAPSARLIVPTAFTGVAQDSLIQLGFNELIDATPFLQATPTNTPVSFQVARTQDIGGGVRTCNPEFTALAGQMHLELLPELPNGIGAVLTFTPAAPLPGTSCVRITVTDQVHDLSGRAAGIQTFEFQTVTVAQVTESVVEEFENDADLDPDVSSGNWANGLATFGRLGGDGRHGAFDVDDVALLNNLFTDVTVGAGVRTLQINTDSAVIPASRTISGAQIPISDGRFFFTSMVVPANTRLVFTGSKPPLITVRGLIQIDGTIDLNGGSTSWFFPNQPSPPFNPAIDPLFNGQPGGLGGIFAGNGGAGGRRCAGTGPRGDENGVNGQDCRVPTGHAFAAQVVATGGRGAAMFPAHGQTTLVGFPPQTSGSPSAYAMEAAAGGGGGGYLVAGGAGRCITNSRNDLISGLPPRLDYMGPPSPGGVAFPVLPIPSGQLSSLHLLVGGSGGGGGASHPSLLLQAVAVGRAWGPGCGGGGGGGAIALRSGRVLRIAAVGKVLARGGSAGISPTVTSVFAQSGPAGGGSGGSILLQSGDQVQLLGELNVLGGSKGVLFQSTPVSSPPEFGGTLRTEGGDGSPGLIRLERIGASVSDLPNAQPTPGPNNIAELTDTDSRVAFQSRFYSTGHPFAPEFLRYEIRAIIDGQPVLFSDDPSTGGIPARAGFGPLEAFWQGARKDLTTGEIDPFDIRDRPWRSLVGGTSGLAVDGRNAFRFLLILDRTNGQTVEIDSVKVFFRV